MTTNGIDIMAPSTVDKTGGSSVASINSDGSVTFSSCTTLSLNNVFTSNYDNYLIVMTGTPASSDEIRMRLRSSGADNTDSVYNIQYLNADGTSYSTGRMTSRDYGYMVGFGTITSGLTFYVFGPHLSQKTIVRSTGAGSPSNAQIIDAVIFHNLASSYDGITLYASFYDISGKISVYGFNQ